MIQLLGLKPEVQVWYVETDYFFNMFAYLALFSSSVLVAILMSK